MTKKDKTPPLSIKDALTLILRSFEDRHSVHLKDIGDSCEASLQWDTHASKLVTAQPGMIHEFSVYNADDIRDAFYQAFNLIVPRTTESVPARPGFSKTPKEESVYHQIIEAAEKLKEVEYKDVYVKPARGLHCTEEFYGKLIKEHELAIGESPQNLRTDILSLCGLPIRSYDPKAWAIVGEVLGQNLADKDWVLVK